MITKEDILSALKGVVDPELGVDVVELEMIKEIKIEDGKVKIKVATNYAGTPLAEYLLDNIKQKVDALPEVREVEVELVSKDWEP